MKDETDKLTEADKEELLDRIEELEERVGNLEQRG
jgi:hypothetical protein